MSLFKNTERIEFSDCEKNTRSNTSQKLNHIKFKKISGELKFKNFTKNDFGCFDDFVNKLPGNDDIVAPSPQQCSKIESTFSLLKLRGDNK
jgi:hypothetical protein